jgi:hypothetical protein
MVDVLSVSEWNKIRSVNQHFAFPAPFGWQRSLVGFDGKLEDVILNLRVNLELNDSARRVSVKASAQRLHDAIQTDFHTHVLTAAWD